MRTAVGVPACPRSSAARRCRSGADENVNPNAAGAVNDTAIPCGTIGSSAG